MIYPVLFCRKGLMGLRRGPRWKMTVAPLQRESGPAAEPGGPYGSATDEKRDDGGDGMSGFRRRRSPELKFSSVKFRDNFFSSEGRVVSEEV